MFRKVAKNIPPATAVPTECRAFLPGAGREDQRHDAEDERERRHQDRPQPDARRLDGGVDHRHAPCAQLLRELDDQDRVLRREADQHHEPDLAVQSFCSPRSPLRRQRAEHRQRHAQQHDERQHQDSYCAASVR